MDLPDRPESVLEGPTRFAGYNCVACVTAVLHNEVRNGSFAIANLVAARYNIAPKDSLTVNRALEIIRDFTKLVPSHGRMDPWGENAKPGHYAVFCMARRHVIYAYRYSDGHSPQYYLYDPQSEKDQDWVKLQAQGFGPFQSFHFAP
jgi:hypothetical protein